MMEDEDLKAELTCPICMDLFREPRRLPCGHVYCRVCLQDMLTRKYLNMRASERILSCPECRQRYDLTFQEAGVDVFTRDFKLFRLVELFQKKFSRSREDGDGDGGAGTGADDEQTAVKTVQDTEREASPQTSSTVEPSTSASSSTPSPPRPSLSLDPPELDHQNSPVVSLSDDSWIYVSSDNHHRILRPPGPPPHLAVRHQRGDDSWLLPADDGDQFPVDRGQYIRGSASTDVSYRTLPAGDVQPIVAVSGRYNNTAPETFQRFVVDEPTVQVVRLPSNPAPVTSPSSESSSESDTSDERGDEGSRSGDDVSGSGSDVGRNRRSRLSRFFRSLVMSDTDSYDEDDHGFPRVGVNNGERHTAYPPNHHQHPPPYPHRPPPHHHHQPAHHSGDFMQRVACNQLPMSAPGLEERGGEGPGSLPEPSYYENTGMSSLPPHSDNHSMPVTEYERARAAEQHEQAYHDPSHGSLAENARSQRNTASVRADIMHADSAAGGRGVTSTGRNRSRVNASDDSDEDYEPQTSMLRPKRKPRSRLKKFFTSLLSLSSSDDDDENIEGQMSAPSTSTAERH